MQPNETTPEAATRPLPIVVGPGTGTQKTNDYEAALAGATRDEVVEILNPLTMDFIARVAVTKTAMMPVRIGRNPSGSPFNESDLERSGVTGFRNTDKGGGVVHIVNDITIPAGTTIRQSGDVAQVIVKQLINAVLQIRGDKHKLADPVSRREVEAEVIISRRPMSELFGGGGPITVEEQMKAAIEKANTQATEPEFPHLIPDPKPAKSLLDKRRDG